MSNYINRQYLYDFESDLIYKVVDAWSRTMKRLWWPRLMLLETGGGRERIIEWNQETARIHHLGPRGKDLHFDPLVTASLTLQYEHFGNALSLDRAQMTDDKIDRAAKWASETGAACLYWPQRLAASMMINGKTGTNPISGKPLLAFDGLPFFDKAHPVGGDSGFEYSNLHSGVPFSADSLARVCAYVESIKHGGAAPAGLMPTLIIVPSNYRLRATQLTSSEWFTDVLNTTQAAAGMNVFKQAFEFEPPIVAPELNAESDVWYVAVPADNDAFDGAMGYWEREPFSINSYTPQSNFELAKVKEYVWENYGRNFGFYGLPYRLHRCESTGSQDSYLSSLDL